MLWYLDLRDLAEAQRYFFEEERVESSGETNMMLSKRMDSAKEKDYLIELVIQAKGRAARPNPTLIMPCFTGSSQHTTFIAVARPENYIGTEV